MAEPPRKQPPRKKVTGRKKRRATVRIGGISQSNFANATMNRAQKSESKDSREAGENTDADSAQGDD